MRARDVGTRLVKIAAVLLCAGMLAAAGAAVRPAMSARPAEHDRIDHTGDRSRVAGRAPQLHVAGNRLVDRIGQRIVLHGIDRSGGMSQCEHGFGIWDGPMDQASINAMKRWHVNAVRVPLNEACWNGESYILPQFRGARYRRAVEAYVRLLGRNGMVAILDLHFTDGIYTGPSSACSSAQAVCEKPMPDAAQSIPFWSSVARTFKGNDAVIFDVFNEPFPQAANGEAAGWRCWLRGGSSCAGIGYKVAGMQSLVSAIRSVGADNVIMLGGIGWANDLTQWLQHEPVDPDHNLAVSWHSYNFNPCATRSCWDSQIAPVIAKIPVIVGEMGENDCADTYIMPLMRWLDARSTSYLAWAWNADYTCSAGPSLITNYSGTPTAYGKGYRSHLLSTWSSGFDRHLSKSATAPWPVRRHGVLVLAGNGTAYDLDSLAVNWDPSIGVPWTVQNIEFAPGIPGLYIADAPYTTALMGTSGRWSHSDCVHAHYGGVPQRTAIHVGHAICIRTRNVRRKKSDGGHYVLIIVKNRSRHSLTLEVTVWRC
jgi:hypothetical protein